MFPLILPALDRDCGRGVIGIVIWGGGYSHPSQGLLVYRGEHPKLRA